MTPNDLASVQPRLPKKVKPSPVNKEHATTKTATVPLSDEEEVLLESEIQRDARLQQTKFARSDLENVRRDAYNPNNVYQDNRMRIDSFPVSVDPPTEDYGDPDEDESGRSEGGGLGRGNAGAQSMRYTGWFNNPEIMRLREAELERQYNGNMVLRPNPNKSVTRGGDRTGGLLWDDGTNSFRDNSSRNDDYGIAGTRKRGRDFVGGPEVEEGIDPGGDRGYEEEPGTSYDRGKKAKTGEHYGIDRRRTGVRGMYEDKRGGRDGTTDDMYRSANSWQYEKDPDGSGKSWLLRKLKAKFLETSSPVVDFVAAYLGATGKDPSDESALYGYIKVLSKVEKTNEAEPGDYEALINHLYSHDAQMANGLMAWLSLHLKEKKNVYRKLAQSKRSLREKRNNYDNDPTAENEATLESAKRTLVETIKERNSFEEDYEDTSTKNSSAYGGINKERYKALVKRMLRDHEYVVEGRVVFTLNVIFRNQAQMVLDEINANCHGTETHRYFTLLEVMKSEVVRSKFIRMMILTAQGANVGGVSPITMNGRPGMAGNASSYGGGDRTLVVQTRPTKANLVAGSLEYWEGMNLFSRVKKSKARGGSLVWDIKGKSTINSNPSFSRIGQGGSYSYSGTSYGTNSRPLPILSNNISVGPYGSTKRRNDEPSSSAFTVSEIKESIYYDVVDNVFRSSVFPEHAGVKGGREESLGVFIRENVLKSMGPERSRNIPVDVGDGRRIDVVAGYGPPIREVRNRARDARTLPLKPGEIAHHRNKTTGKRQLVNMDVMRDSNHFREFYRTGTVPKLYSLGNLGRT